jgi:hypothetical protein
MREVEIECEECHGLGHYDAQECYQPASSCCGGCYKTYQCEDCKGTGLIEIEIEEDEEE